MPIDPTDLELDYRAKNYQYSKTIKPKQIACATCGTNLSAKIKKPGGVFIHPFIKTLQCKKCSDFYGDGNFSMDEDGDDKYCRLCGNGGELYICGKKPCPYGFCQKCVERYIGKNSSEVEADDWKCFHCNCKPLWEVRAVCAVIIPEKSTIVFQTTKTWNGKPDSCIACQGMKRKKNGGSTQKKKTRSQVWDSDDNRSRSEDLDSDFQSSKRVIRRPLRTLATSNIRSKALDKIRRICDSSSDLLDHLDLPNKSTTGKGVANTKSGQINAGAKQKYLAKKNNHRLSEEIERLSNSESESSDLDEREIIRKKHNDSEFQRSLVELESKSIASKKQNNQSSTVSRTDKQSSDSEIEGENLEIRTQVTSSSTVNKESSQKAQVERLSTKPPCPMSQTSSFDLSKGVLDKKKSCIEGSYEKISSSKDCVIKDDARMIKDRLDNLVNKMKLFGKSLYAEANKIATKQLTNSLTSVPTVSGTLLECALLMLRCKNNLEIIENEFKESYENWCRSSKVESVFSDMTKPDYLTTRNRVESTTEDERFDDHAENDRMRRELKAKKTARNSADKSNSDNGDDDDDFQSTVNNWKSKLIDLDCSSSAQANENVEDLADCDETMISTQLPSHHSSTNSDAEEITLLSSEANLGITADTNMSNLENGSDNEVPLQNNICCRNVASPFKEGSKSPETNAEQHEEAPDSDSGKNHQEKSNRTEKRKESQESVNLVENRLAAPFSDNKANDTSENNCTVGEDGTGEADGQKKQAAATVDDEEEAIKRKVLEESDSEWFEDSLAIPNNFELEVNSELDENTKQALPEDTTSTIVTSKMLAAGEKSRSSKIETDESKTDPMSPQSVDMDVSALNNLAKRRLLLSLDSSISDSADMSLPLPVNTAHVDSQSTSSLENNEIASTTDSETESTATTRYRTKKRKFNLAKNYFYRRDKKLRMNCEVVVRRLDENILDQFRELLGKSRERQEWENFERLIDLNNIENRTRVGSAKESYQSESSSESSSSKESSKGHVKKTKSKQVPAEKEETLLEHLEKMKNGENYCNSSGDETDQETNAPSKISAADKGEEEFLRRANKLAKDFLLQSSDSDNETENVVEDTLEKEEEQEGDEEQEQEPELDMQEEKQTDEDIPNEQAADPLTNHENGSNAETGNEEAEENAEKEDADSKQGDDSDSDITRKRKKMKEGLAKRYWRLTDSDSSGDEKKRKKSQLKKSMEKSDEAKEESSKQKKKVKRRVLGSDSDSVKLTDVSDDSAEDNNSSSDLTYWSRLFKNMREKRRRKRTAVQKCISDSESEQDEKPLV